MIRPFMLSDVKSINKWLKRRGHPLVKYSDLPLIGFIIPGVAVMFLRQCEGGYGIIDSMCSNPLVSSETRHRCMDILYNRTLSIPGFKNLIGFTSDEGALERAKRHGFKQIHQAVLTLSKE